MGPSPFLERVGQNPNAFLFGCIMFIPLIIWTLSLMHWMISGEIEAMTGVTGIFFALFLAYTAMKPPVDWLSPVIFFGMILLAILIPFIRSSMTQRELKLIELEILERNMSSLQKRPDMTITRMDVARRLIQFGLVGHALAIVEPIKHLPARQFGQEQREIRQWESYATPENLRPITCLRCNQNGDVNAMTCPHCGAPYISLYLRGSVLMPALAKKLIVGWILGIGLLLAIPSVALAVPPAASLVLIPLMLLLGGYTAYRAFFAQPLSPT